MYTLILFFHDWLCRVSQVLKLMKSAMQPVLSDIKTEWCLPEQYDVIQSPQEHAACFKGGTINIFGLLFPHISVEYSQQEVTTGSNSSRFNKRPPISLANCNYGIFYSGGTVDSDQSASVEGVTGNGSRQQSMDRTPGPQTDDAIGLFFVVKPSPVWL